jgi:hypothetical protein
VTSLEIWNLKTEIDSSDYWADHPESYITLQIRRGLAISVTSVSYAADWTNGATAMAILIMTIYSLHAQAVKLIVTVFNKYHKHNETKDYQQL